MTNKDMYNYIHNRLNEMAEEGVPGLWIKPESFSYMTDIIDYIEKKYNDGCDMLDYYKFVSSVYHDYKEKESANE